MSQCGLERVMSAAYWRQHEIWESADHCFRQWEDVSDTLADSRLNTFEDLVSVENLVACYLACRKLGDRAAGIDRLKYSSFSAAEVWDCLRAYSRALLEDTYRPQQVRQVQIPKPNGKKRTLQIGTCLDSVISKAVQRFICHEVEPKLADSVYAYRPGRGVHDLFAALHNVVRETGDTVLVCVDVADAFPSTRLPHLFEVLPHFVTDPRTRTLIERIARGDETQPIPGLRQGDPLSPDLFNISFSPLDTWLGCQDEITFQARYADDLCFLVRNESDAIRILGDLELQLQQQGLRLKPASQRIWDLSKSSVPEHLGFCAGLAIGQLVLNLTDNSWQDLELKLLECSSKRAPHEAATQVVRSWISAYGPGLQQLDGARTGRLLLEALGRADFHLQRRKILSWIDQAIERWQKRLLGNKREQMSVNAPHDLRNRACLRTSASVLTDGDPDVAPFDASNGGDGEQASGWRTGYTSPHMATPEAANRRRRLKLRM